MAFLSNVILCMYFKYVLLVFSSMETIASTLNSSDCEGVCSSNGNDMEPILLHTIELERQDFEESGVCLASSVRKNETSIFDLGLCSRVEYGSPAIPSTLQESRCFCDSKCHLYHDCCIDKVARGDSLNTNRWGCFMIKQLRNRIPLYVVQRCPEEYSDVPVRSLCEFDASVLQEAGEKFHYLQNIPSHSAKTGIMYKNVFCALCNNDAQKLTKWTTHAHCNGAWNSMNTTSLDLIRQGRYDAKKNSWDVYVSGKLKSCYVIVEEFTNWTRFSKFGARLCKRAIANCPPSTDQELLNKCQAYTAYVYLQDLNKTVYKNFHCAKCNAANINNITCWDPWYFPLLSGIQRHSWMPLLFDFNFGDDDQVGGPSSKCRLDNGQIWDPILLLCLNMTCGRLYEEVNGQCVRKQVTNVTHGLDSDCRKVILTNDYFVVIENESIYVNDSRRTYSRNEYEPHAYDAEGTLTQVLVCETTDLVFDFDPIQVLLSEFTLGISLTCLFLHLAAYSLLSKLRNRPGKVLMSLTSTLTCGHLFFLVGSYCTKIFWLCYLDAILMYYGYLSAFFWMNIMAYDVYKTFSASRTRSVDHRWIFLKYSIYAWLGSFLIVLASCVTDYVFPQSLFSPKFARGVCWFNHKKGLFLFFSLPLALLLLANLIFFLVTAFSIRKVATQSKMVNNFSEKKRYFLYVKLAVMLGLTWIFGFLAASLKVSALWYPFIVLNGLQGAFIFLVFTFKRKIGKMLVVKLKLRSDKYALSDEKGGQKAFYRSFSNMTTLQTSLTSTLAAVASGNPDMLTAVRRLNTTEKT